MAKSQSVADRLRNIASLAVALRLLPALLLILSALTLAPANSSANAPPYVLLMVTSDDCPHCRKWEREIGVTYDASVQARLAPLVRLHPNDPRLLGLEGKAYTPTFILVSEGRERSRSVGYTTPKNFWNWLDSLLPAPGLPRHGPSAAPQPDLTATPQVLRTQPTASRL